MEWVSYSALMGEQQAFLTLKIDTHEPVEIGNFVGAFTSLANEFERYVKAEYPDVKAEPRMFVREVRYGCIEADMITGLAVTVANGVGHLMVLEDFVRRWGARFNMLLTGHIPQGQLESSQELKDWAKAAQSIATDPVASHRISVAKFVDGQREIAASFEFTTPEARTVEANIETRIERLAKPDTKPRERVLMRFTRTDVHDATVNKRTGERVVIDELSPKNKPVMFLSEMVEHEIRAAIRDADENVYKRGFVVDVVCQVSGDKVLAYAVKALHSVIELDDE
jgi:ribosomal protein S17